MQLVVLGLSHRTAPVEQREKAALTDSAARSLLAELRGGGLSEAVSISTCNRTEVYAVGHDAGVVEAAIRAALVAHTRIDEAALDCATYAFRDERAAVHLFRVSSSLDSMVVGESEIQGQVRAAWDLAVEERACGPVLGQLFRQALEVGKRARSETAISRGLISVSSVAVDVARRALTGVPGGKVVLIGAGQMAETTARSLRGHGVEHVTVINRTVSTARELAGRIGGRGVGFDHMAEELADADIVISSTDAPHQILHPDNIAAAMALRPDRPMVLIDIAVPRDLDPAIAAVSGVVLHDIDDLEQVVEANLNGRAAEAVRAEAIVAEEGNRYTGWRRGLEVVPTISTLREHAERIRSHEVGRLDAQWESLTDADRERVERLTQSIVNTLLHDPIVRAKAAAENGEGLRHVESLKHLFGLATVDSGSVPSS